MSIVQSLLSLFRSKATEDALAAGDTVVVVAKQPSAQVVELEQVDPEVVRYVDAIHAFAWGFGLAQPPFPRMHRTRNQVFGELTPLAPAELSYLIAAEMYPDFADFRQRGPKENRASWLAEFRRKARSRGVQELIVRAIGHGALLSLTGDIENLLRQRAKARLQQGGCALRHFQDPDEHREKKHVVDADGEVLFLRIRVAEPGDDYHELLDVPHGRVNITMTTLSGWEVLDGWYEPSSDARGFGRRRGGGGTDSGKNEPSGGAPRGVDVVRRR